MPTLLYHRFCVLLVGFLAFSCMASTVISEQRPLDWATSIDQTSNFYKVTPTLYRSEQPNRLNVSALEKLNIQTVINLRDWHSDDKLLGKTGIRLIRIPIKTWNIHDWQIAQALVEIEKGSQYGNVLVHCQHGADRTGLIIAMHRIIYQHWPIEKAKLEMKQGGYGFHGIWKNIEQFFTVQHVEAIRHLIAKQTTSHAEVQGRPIRP
ncbi:hypothetical protein BKE30_03780 [Alkanindiges hydrocarboniclasticus]|uniref:diphosphoinositol-polyphosphate diphosphatase n=2 Tax=Alkanindiges hydrocarboniclasticus TaxID=1907941 RepID=A0A1S8CX14_9GAMM|nr:hypothetical protein BKE30_03780 [Alkanindiges hydrocarboniclasticus]